MCIFMRPPPLVLKMEIFELQSCATPVKNKYDPGHIFKSIFCVGFLTVLPGPWSRVKPENSYLNPKLDKDKYQIRT